MPHPHRRRCRLGGMLTAAAGISTGALLWSAGARSQLYAPRPLAGSWSLQQQDRSFAPPPEYLRSPPPEFLLSPSPELLPACARAPAPAHRRRKAPRRLLPPRPKSTPQHREQVDAVLLPDREVLVLSAEPASAKGATCVFQGGASSSARALGRLPGPGRHAYLCLLPDSAQQSIQPPLLISSSSSAAAAPRAPAPAAGKLLDWNDTMVFDSALLQGGDVLVFAKGPSHRKGVIRTATADVQCIYRAGAREASFPAIASAQQTHHVLLLCSFKEQFQQHVRVYAMEAVLGCWELEQSLQSLTGASPGKGTRATMSDDEDNQVDSEANLFDGNDGSDGMGFAPLILTEGERSWIEFVRHELKSELKQGYKQKLVDIREEIMRKRTAGKLPGDTAATLKANAPRTPYSLRCIQGKK